MAYTRELEGGRILPNNREVVLQQCGYCRRAGRMKGRLIRAHTTTRKRISCKGQLGLYTILPSPTVYGVWHTKGRSVGGVYYAMAMQSYCTRVGVAGGGGQ